MKKLALTLLISTMLAGSALAVDTATLDVTATVIATCQFDSNGGTIDFGSIDALAPVDILAQPADVNPFFTCSAGTNYAITDDAAVNPLDSGTDTIVYALNYAAAGVATGASEELVVTGDLLGADYAGKPAGVYNATVTFTINP